MNSKQAHPFTSLSLSITTTNSRALPRPALQRRPELRARGADAVGQLVQPGGAGVWVRRQRGRKVWGQKRDFFFSFSLKKKKTYHHDHHHHHHLSPETSRSSTPRATTSPRPLPASRRPLSRGSTTEASARRRTIACCCSPSPRGSSFTGERKRLVVFSFSESRRPLFQPRHSVRSPSYCILRACTMPFFLLGKSASRASNNAKTLDLHYNYHDKKNTKIQTQNLIRYSTTKGAAQYIQLNSEQSVEPGSTQRAWLLSTLAAVDRSKTPWLIVSIHR